MCLAVPGEVKSLLGHDQALVSFMGLEKKVSIDLLDNIRPGDYVIVHAGFAINKLNKTEALKSINCFEEMFGSD